MVLGLLPAIRGGLGELAKTGQHTRLIDGYLKPYARAFEAVRYFSYLPESLDAYSTDPELATRVRVYRGGGWHPWAYAFAMPFRYRIAFRGCAILRVFQVTGVIPALIAKRRFGVPFVTTYGFWYGRLARSRATGALRRAVEALGLRAADAVIVTTPELGAHVAARVGAAKVHLIPNGVDTTRFAPAPRTARRAKNVLYVGRLSEEKNLGAVVEAAARLAGRFDLMLTFVGDGPARQSLEAEAPRRGGASDFVPVVAHRRVPAHLADAAACALPSSIAADPQALLGAMSGVVLGTGARRVAGGPWRPPLGRARRWVRLNREAGERTDGICGGQGQRRRDASADWGVRVEVLQYVVSPGAAMREIARGLAPGG